MGKRRRYHRGKRISKGEMEIVLFLERNNIRYTREQTFIGCNGVKKPLRFDFFLVDYNLCIEFQGQHHYGPVNKGRRAKIVHETTKRYDAIKKKYLSSYTTDLIEIAYWDFDNIDSILTESLNLS